MKAFNNFVAMVTIVALQLAVVMAAIAVLLLSFGWAKGVFNGAN